MGNRDNLSDSAIALLQAVFDHFNETGEWPNSFELHVELREMGDLWQNAGALGLNYIDAQRNSDPSFTTLTVLGISVCRGSERILELFLSAVKYFVQKYIDNPRDSKVTGIELMMALKIEHNELTRLVKIMATGNRFSLGFENPSDPYSFAIRLSKDIINFEKVNTINDYLVLAYPWEFNKPEPQAEKKQSLWDYMPLYPGNRIHVGVFKPSSLSISELLQLLNPVIYENCHTLFESGHYPAAVEKGFKIARERLRELTGYETGSEAFGKGKLHIRGAAADHVDGEFNEAVKFLCMAIDRFRNEASHSSDSRIDHPARAYEYLTLCSLAMNLLDDAEILQ